MTLEARAAHDRALYLRGLTRFNEGAYYDSHEDLEDLWLRNRSPARPFLQALIQLAAAGHHFERGHRLAFERLLAGASARLSPFEPRMLGLHVAPLSLGIARCHADVEALGAAGWHTFDRTRLPRYEFEPPPMAEFWPHRGTVAGPRRRYAWDRETC